MAIIGQRRTNRKGDCDFDSQTPTGGYQNSWQPCARLKSGVIIIFMKSGVIIIFSIAFIHWNIVNTILTTFKTINSGLVKLTFVE